MYKHPSLNYTLGPDDELVTCPYDGSHKVLQPRLSRHLVKCRTAYKKDPKKVELFSIEICRWNSNHHIPLAVMKEHELSCKDRECMTEHLLYHSDPNWKAPGPPPQEPVKKVLAPRSTKWPEFKKPQRMAANFPGLETEEEEEEEEEDWGVPVNDNGGEATVVENSDSAQSGAGEVSGSSELVEEGKISLSKQEYPIGIPLGRTTGIGYDPAVRLQTEPLIFVPQGLTRSERKEHRKLTNKRWNDQEMYGVVFVRPEVTEADKNSEDEDDPDPPESVVKIMVTESGVEAADP